MKLRFACQCLVLAVVGCSTTELAPPPPPPEPPAYLHVPHPAGTDILDMSALFHTPGAPSAESLKDCDGDFRKLNALTSSKQEVQEGVRELVAANPVAYHWCFYGRLLELNNFLKGDSFIDERQKKTLETYQFVVPVARGFMTAFRDSRYLRNAVTQYRRVSEWIFFRKLELTPRATSELVDAANPFGLYRTPENDDGVLQKYNVSVGKAESIEPARAQAETQAQAQAPDQSQAQLPSEQAPLPGGDREPAAQPQPSPSVTPSEAPSPAPSPAPSSSGTQP